MKEQILKRLLEEKHITLDEFIILLNKETVKEYIYIPQSYYLQSYYSQYPIYKQFYITTW